MNQLQIGRFIAECRKEKGLTQSQLAEKLGITNRAVSKWETGNSMPDVSIMIELCEIFSISVNDLLCGKKLNTEEQKMENEKNTLSMVLAKKELFHLKMSAKILMSCGVTFAVSLTLFMAETLEQKIATILFGSFVLGYGIWLRVKIEKSLKKM